MPRQIDLAPPSLHVEQPAKPSRKRPAVWLVQWHPIAEPVPEGWRVARQRYSHHTAFYGSVLIEQVPA